MNIVGQAHKKYEPGVPYVVPTYERSLFDLLATTAAFYPQRVALDYFGAETTYNDVLQQSEKAAGLLVAAGVKKGDTVALVLPNCPQAFVAFYACMRIGAITAQHNPLAPAAELAGQFQRHHAKIAIVWEKAIQSCPIDGSTGLETVFSVDISAGFPASQRLLLKLPVKMAREKRGQLRSDVPQGIRSWDKEVAGSAPVSPSVPHASADDIAVILHTGGTNGVPKSVPLSHRNIGTNVDQCMFWVFALHEGAEVFFSLLPYFHAFGLTFFLCAAVKKAATQVVLPKFDPEMALAAHRRRPVTFFVGVPPMFERIAKEALRSNTDISSIRFSVSGAMPLSLEVADLWERTTGQTIIEGYGLSETSPVLCGAPMSKNRRLGTLGVPFPSTQLRLVDLEDPTRDVADGEPGEIIVKGPQVFSGYLDAPEETARVFTDDGWFRTGDIGVNKEGYINLADRKKELIISGGFNVYPSQVEAAIRLMPGVADVAVVGTPGHGDQEDVTAAVIMEEGTPEISLEEVRAWAEETISHYALPRKIVFISELPRNPIGKVLRRKVKEQILDSTSRAFESIKDMASGSSDEQVEPDDQRE